MLGRDSPQQKPDLGRSRTKNNLPAAQEERRAKRAQITHMSGGESSASIFWDNRGEHGVWCNSMHNSRAAAQNSLQAFLGQQSSRRSIPPGSRPPSGEELPCLVPGSRREPQCSCAEEKRLPAQSLLSSPKRQQQQPEQLEAQRTCKLVLGGRVFSHLQLLQQQSPRNALPDRAGMSGAWRGLEKQERKSECAKQSKEAHPMPASCQRLLVQTHLVFSRSSKSPDPHSCQGRGEDRACCPLA